MLLRKQSQRSIVKYVVHHNFAQQPQIKVWFWVRGWVVPYWKDTLEIFEAFVNIDFDFASELQKKH